MRPPPRVSSNRDVNLADLPFEALDKILNYVRNIRQRIRLMRVCRRFHDVILVHLSRTRYRLVNKKDYLYESETESVNRFAQRVLNITQLLRMAPRLTHFNAKMDHVYFDVIHTARGFIPKRSSPQYLRCVNLNHSKAFFTNNQRWYYFLRVDLLIAKAPCLQTLHLTVTRLIDFVMPRSEILRTVRFNYFLDDRYFNGVKFERVNARKINGSPVSRNPISFYGIIDGMAPNLTELEIHLKHMDAQLQLNSILWRISHNCSNLMSLSIFFDQCVWQMELYRIIRYGPWHLPELYVIEIRGVTVPPGCWEVIFNACPKLRCCVLDNDYHPAVFNMASRRKLFLIGRRSTPFHV